MSRVALLLWVALGVLPVGTPAQGAPQAAWLRDLAGSEPLAREIARRHLALAGTLPARQLAQLLQHEDPGVVLAAVTLLRDRRVELAALRKISAHPDLLVRRAILPVASDAFLARTLAEGPAELRVPALFVLEDRGLLTEDQLLRALTGADPAVAEAACRLVVLERSPFPIPIADKVIGHPGARRLMLGFLADRPRDRSGPWLLRILGQKDLSAMERMLAINSLPTRFVDDRLAKEVLVAAAGDDTALSNRAAYAAMRFERRLADKLVPAVMSMLAGATSVSALLPCLSRISAAGERALLEFALTAPRDARGEIFHWLSSRESKLVDTYVAKALDGDAPFPKELVRLAGPVLTTRARIDRIARFLGDPTRAAVDAFDALIEAEVYHPALYEYAKPQPRRLWRVLALPLAKLPEKMFTDILARGDLSECTYAIDSLSRGDIPAVFERAVLGFAKDSLHEGVQLSACRALIRGSSEASGRVAWRILRAGSNEAKAIRWLMEKPKPWSYEDLLKERESLQKAANSTQRPTLHQVLIALARLGDRSATEELVDEIPFLGPAEMRHVQELMGRYLKRADLEKLAATHLEVRGAKGGSKSVDTAMDDDRRVELLEWLLDRKGLDLTPMLTRLWKTDASYEIRLTALRGLLAQDSEELDEELRRLLARPRGEDDEELAFEVIGSMALPMSRQAIELLAYIVLRTPLIDSSQEIRLSVRPARDGWRGAYPLLRPAANLLRRDERGRPGAGFDVVARQIGDRRFALNRQRLGLFLGAIQLREQLADDLGPVLARLILDAPDSSPDFVPPAQMVLARAAEGRGDYPEAVELYAAASRAFNRGIVPDRIRRTFLGVVDPLAGYHSLAALSAKALICRARAVDGDPAAARKLLGRARDLAEGDRETIDEIKRLRRALQR